MKPATRAAVWMTALALSPALLATDTILVNGHIYTGNPEQKWAEAVAITGGRIDAVGSNADILKRKDARTQVIQLQSRTVIPGIIDTHTHMWFGALALHGFNLATPEVWIDPLKDPDAFVAKIQEYAATHPKDKVLFGRANFSFEVTHELLDKAASDRPIVVHAATEHTYWVNQKALDLAGITDKPVADPTVEKFVGRDKNGHPTGILREASMDLMERALPLQPMDEKMAWMREAALYLNRLGITGVTNATGNLAEIQVYGALRNKGDLTVRTRTAFASVGFNQHLTPEFLADIEKARTTYRDDWVSANLIKFFADGAGGPPLYEQAEMNRLMIELDKRGFQIMTHALQPAAAKMVLNAYEEVEKTNGPRDRRLRIEHAINIAPEDVPRFAALSVTASMQPELCCFRDRPDAPSNVWQSFEKLGVNLAFGSDWPCTWPASPFAGVQQAVTRSFKQLFTPPNLAAPVELVSQDQRLTVEQAVDAYTRGSSRAQFTDDRLGTLDAGKYADLVVLSQDIFSVPNTEIGKTHPVLTMIGGKAVYSELK